MEPNKSLESNLPQQNLTRSAEGCSSGLRPEDLMLGGHEGANPHVGQRPATDGDLENAIPGPSHSLRVSESTVRKELTRLEIFGLLLEECKKKDLRQRPSDLSRKERIDLINKALAASVANFISKSEIFYQKCNRSMPYLIKKHKQWFDQVFVAGILIPPLPSTSATITSPRTDKFKKLCPRQQQRLKRSLAMNLTAEPQVKVVKAFVDTVSTEYGEPLTNKAVQDLERVIITCLETPSNATTISNTLKHSTQLRPYTPNEALAVLIDRKLSVETYKFLQTDANDRGFPLYPPYYKVQEARKSCYPSEPVEVSESSESSSIKKKSETL
ncbi:uncharacterized protein LOC113499977 [Trichoplusia ni]|uniref:Uncharacterized protein LOC113499977 n=1 Tax=Trichoplusia ni TaxID=7111 RepID=A0A7E5W6X9_TRINI|nr:uncharacterized protein LOC113499977 [Trichoplusia ni]